MFSGVNSYDTANAAIPLHNTLSVGVTRVGLTVGAKPGTMAASHLVTCEASLTFSTAERALGKTVESQGYSATGGW